ncbi:helix-turn-helix domain-containing protein [Streptomyces sp. NPDC059752]|uniref:helix-turn-helix domain-containing protein n=1 Tax=unclassified Streptomyces TaxID=2593676 RepID=UPI0036485ECC
MIRDLRTARGWSQGRLSDRINARYGTALTREYISRWERRAVTPGAYYLRCLSVVLDVPLAVLEGQLDRRVFLTDAAGAGMASLVAYDLFTAGFAARLTGGPTTKAWEAKLATYGPEYMSLGAADVQRRVSAELVTVQQQLDGRRRWPVAARLMTLYAKTSIALSNNGPSLNLLSALFGTAHTAALRGDHPTARALLAEGRRIYAIMTAVPTGVAP